MTQISTASRAATALAAALMAGLAALPAAATTLKITVTNQAAPGGLSLTPLWAAFHDGGFDGFDAGSSASPAIESIAELGDPSGLGSALAAADPLGQAVNIAAPGNGVPTIDPGETASVSVSVDGAASRFFSFFAMVVPSNDTFLGNDDPAAIALFDSLGGFLGPRVLSLTALDLWDAGTEVNDPGNGPAFVAGQTATGGADENGVIHRVESFAAFAGVQTPVGVLDGDAIDFGRAPGLFSVATIRITEVSDVPLPASGALALGGLAAFGLMRLRRI